MMRYPLTESSLPAVKAVLGWKGVVYGTDYRKKSVLAAIKAVPNTEWFLVTKVDTEEIYAPLWALLGDRIFYHSKYIYAWNYCRLYLALSAGKILP